MKLGEIAERLSCSLEGDPDCEILGIAPIETAQAGELSFLVNKKYYADFETTQASALIVGPDFDRGRAAISLLRNPNPYLTFARAAELFAPVQTVIPGIHSTAYVSPKAVMGARVHIGAFAYIGDNALVGDDVRIGTRATILDNAQLGDRTVIHSGVVVRERVTIGRDCVIQDNAVIGSDGFGYAQQDDKSWYPIPQAGTVVIEDHVDVGACSTIDRAAMGETRVGSGTRIDNLVQIGHGCQIGRNCLICAQVGLAGSTKVGDNVILAGQVGAAGHLKIGDGAIVTPQSGLAQSVPAGKMVSGSPAIDHHQWLKNSIILEKLPELKKSLREIQLRVNSLEDKLTALKGKS